MWFESRHVTRPLEEEGKPPALQLPLVCESTVERGRGTFSAGSSIGVVVMTGGRNGWQSWPWGQVHVVVLGPP